MLQHHSMSFFADLRQRISPHKWLILGSAAILLPVLIAWYFCADPFGDDPLCDGKPVSYWIDKMVDVPMNIGGLEYWPTEYTDYIAPEEALKTNSAAAGRALATYLNKHWGDGDTLMSNIEGTICCAMRNFGLVKSPIQNRFFLRRKYRRIAVYDALYYLGKDAEPALPSILKEFMRPQTSRVWYPRLHPTLAAKAWPGLLGVFASTTDIVEKYKVLWSLQVYPPSYGSYSPGEAEKVIAMLRMAIHDKDKTLRENAMSSLGDFASRNRRYSDITAIEKDFIDALKDASPGVRSAACWGLFSIGEKDGPAIQPLMDELNQGNTITLCAAARALGRLDTKNVSTDKIKEYFYKTQPGSMDERALAHALDEMGFPPDQLRDSFFSRMENFDDSLTYTSDPITRVKKCYNIVYRNDVMRPPANDIKIPDDHSEQALRQYWKDMAPNILKCIDAENKFDFQELNSLLLTEPLLWSLPEVREWAIKATASPCPTIREAGWNVLSHDPSSGK